jgi:hypothetical protein
MAAAACTKGDSNHQVTQEEYDDVAQAVASTAATGNGGGDVGSMADSASLATGVMPAGLAVDVSGHVTGSRFGLSYDYRLACSDASGAAQDACDATTDRAEVTLSWSGTLNLSHVQASIQRSGDWTLTGLQSNAPMFNGQGTFQFDISVQSIFRPVTASYHLDYAADYAQIALDPGHRPKGGTIHYSIAAEHMVTNGGSTSTATFDLDAVVTFHADGTATIVLDGSHTYQLDVATGAVERG